jgi:hypothetical protein
MAKRLVGHLEQQTKQMARIFISYNRQDQAETSILAKDIKDLDHAAWFDQDLSGGQAWWEQILAKIRDCDLFIFVLSNTAINSIACQREYNYAYKLSKPILPVLVSDGVSTNLLPTELSQIQFVDYRSQDRSAAIRLARALQTIPQPPPLPNPLPQPPDVPISYLGRLVLEINTTATLNYAEQSALVLELKRGLRDPLTANDARTLLERLRSRPDLLAIIAVEIDEYLLYNQRFERPEELLNPIVVEPDELLSNLETERAAQPITQIELKPVAIDNIKTLSLESSIKPKLESQDVSDNELSENLLNGTLSEQRLWLIWTLACSLGGGLGWFLSILATHFDENLISGAIIGFAIGGAQWLVLLRIGIRMRLWIPLTILGYAIVHSILGLLVSNKNFGIDISSNLLLLEWAIISGMIIALAQWLVLKSVVDLPRKWLLLFSSAYASGDLIAFFLMRMSTVSAGESRIKLAVIGIIAGGASGFVFAVISGKTIYRLRRLYLHQ